MGFLPKFVEILKSIFDNFTLVMIGLIGLFALLVDGPMLKNQGFTREFTIVKIISYSYIGIGIIMLIFLRMI